MANKRHAYDAAFKLKAVDLALHEGNRAAALTLGINESMVRRWRCQREELAQSKKTKKAFRGNKSRWPKLEDFIEDWVNTQRANGRGVSTVQIRLKAKTVATEMKIENFRGGPSWCHRFMKRKGLSIRAQTTVCQQLPPDYAEKITNFRKFTLRKINEYSIGPDKIINVDEVPVTFDLPLTRTVNKQGEPSITVTGGEHMEAPEPGFSADVGEPNLLDTASQRLSEHGEENTFVAAQKEIESKDHKETFSNEESVSTVLLHSAGPSSTSETEREEGPEVKTEEEFELSSEENPAGPGGSKETHMQKTVERITNLNMETDMDTTKETGTQLEQVSSASTSRVSKAEDLDEMMDIGIVDQVEQEAQMKDEQENHLVAEDCSHSPAIFNTVAGINYVEEEEDVKPPVLPPKEEQVEDMKVSLEIKSSSPTSEATASTGRDSSSPATVVNGTKVVNMRIPRLDTGRENAADQPIRASPSPPLVTVKDEPIDEEYDLALISTSSAANIKDEPNMAKDDLRIGSVFSVTPATEAQTLPVVNPSSLHMSCSHCKKSLIKGQTAFQRKGSPALFCSSSCLTTSLPTAKGATKVCHDCQKLIFRPQDVILAPDVKGGMREFCSQSCLTSFNFKQNAFRKASQPISAPPSLCSMCSRYCTSKHEVILSGAVHKLCSDACFNRFRKVNKLSMAGCAHCGSYCHKKPLMLKLEDSNKTVCNVECLAKYKENTKTNQPCMMCKTTRLIGEMIHNKNSDDSVNLFCSSSCVMAFKVQSVSASGARVSCDTCGKNTVPAYHLAMSDTSIRNFCTLPCVMAFQEKFKKSQTQVNVFTKLPVGSSQIQTITSTQNQQEILKAPLKLNCFQCARNINFPPEVIQIKDKLVFLCSIDCAHEFKKDNYVTSLCEYCKIEKITRDAKRINNRDCYFCSDGCKLLFRHDQTKSWGKHCNSCVYCHSVSKKLVTAQYGGSTEEFCSDECRSKYTMLFCHVAKCDTCGHKAKLKQSFSMLGEVKHFCDLTCMLQFCCDKVATQGEIFKGTAEATPVIANVISLAVPPTEKSNASTRTAQQSTQNTDTGTSIQSKNFGNFSVQTDTVKVQPLSGPKILKNKAVLCRPLVQNKGISCKTQTVDVEAQTDDIFPKIMIIPVPVPVYIPVPMNMYSQFTPQPVGLPLPVPVPMFLPVTMDSAERIVETIQEIKQKIPSDPFEAELILMAEMVAEQHEKNKEEERPKEKVLGKERQQVTAPDDHGSNYSDDLDTEDLASFLNNWDEASSDPAVRSPSRPYAHEKLNPVIDIPLGLINEPFPEPTPAMDIEADIPVETLERMARLRDESKRTPSPPPVPARRRQAHRKAREKRGRKSKRSTKTAEASTHKAEAVEVPKLKSEYGVEAWKRWIQKRPTQPNLEKPRFGSRPIELKEDVLRCTTAELSYGLCSFISEVKRPNGEPYSADSIFYLCLGIQQHLFKNGRVENIFMDLFYNKFATEFTTNLRHFKPSITAGYIHSRVEEEFLWECKQLGAYSPIVLLNTLLFFCCKYFGFTTVEQHNQLSFAHVMRCTKTNPDNSKNTFLRFYPPISVNEAEPDPDVPAKRRKEEESKEDILEMMQNTENPLRCPVRLYEFYLSKCSESVKQRTNLFYLQPERCCVPNSPLWFSSSPLDDSTKENMLIRILTVRELHLRTKKDGGIKQKKPDDPPFIPSEEEEGDSE
ncbi:zinc finger MYM-type protein 4-like isoform X2 [Eleginops maclovinus]|uniref:zinc finger MYM-type protein 4-like isoform X2 n=1 Tax=Eleginops maclovinus TaxID=56733 RepID=UPI0030804D8E